MWNTTTESTFRSLRPVLITPNFCRNVGILEPVRRRLLKIFKNIWNEVPRIFSEPVRSKFSTAFQSRLQRPVSAATAQPRASLATYSNKGLGDAHGRPKKARHSFGLDSQSDRTHTNTAEQSRFFSASPLQDTTLTLAAETLRGSPFRTARGFLYLHITKGVRVRFSDRQTARSRRNVRTRECKMVCFFGGFRRENSKVVSASIA